MALQRMLLPRVYNNFFRTVIIFQSQYNGSPVSTRAPTIELDDAIDSFTTELLRNRKKLNKISNKYKFFSSPQKYCNIDLTSLSKIQLREMFNCALQECDDLGVIKLLEECLKYNTCPDPDILLNVLRICAQKGEVNLIRELKQLCEIKNIAVNFDFLIYEAHALWVRGNVIRALELFEKLYEINPFSRRYIRVSMKELVFDGARKNSEVILMNIIKFTEKIAEKYKDYFLMSCVWEVCFMSEWFSDQQIALELLRKNKRLGELLVSRLPHILSSSLKNHKTEATYRMLEILLNFDMKEQYALVVMALLDYQFLQRNMGSYAEIIKWCQCNNVTLPSIYNEKYLQLLLDKPDGRIYLPPSRHKKNDFKFIF